MKLAYITAEQAESLMVRPGQFAPQELINARHEILISRHNAPYLPPGAVGMWAGWMLCVDGMRETWGSGRAEDFWVVNPSLHGYEILREVSGIDNHPARSVENDAHSIIGSALGRAKQSRLEIDILSARLREVIESWEARTGLEVSGVEIERLERVRIVGDKAGGRAERSGGVAVTCRAGIGSKP